ncbi:hypothetical protein [Acidovorax phage ACPWH]|nr:hypothetical protein [Acidovorax phage ACPWH]QXV72255.1 hypothetical protein Acf1_00058 [Acidovorax phage ACF1]
MREQFEQQMLRESLAIYEAALTQSLLRSDTGNPASAHKLNADQSVAVATDVFFNEDMTTCPVGLKVQLLGAGGVATYGTYNGRDTFWIGWAPVPKRRAR